MSEWRSIESAPKDGTPVLVAVRGMTGHWEHLNDRLFVARHQGYTPSKFDLGWSLFPGFGGVSDFNICGWQPAPELPPPPTEESER